MARCNPSRPLHRGQGVASITSVRMEWTKVNEAHDELVERLRAEDKAALGSNRRENCRGSMPRWRFRPSFQRQRRQRGALKPIASLLRTGRSSWTISTAIARSRPLRTGSLAHALWRWGKPPTPIQGAESRKGEPMASRLRWRHCVPATFEVLDGLKDWEDRLARGNHSLDDWAVGILKSDLTHIDDPLVFSHPATGAGGRPASPGRTCSTAVTPLTKTRRPTNSSPGILPGGG